MQANHFLLDAIIKEFAGKNIVLDFVGSDIPGIAHFYKNFGPTISLISFIDFNNLPWFARVIQEIISLANRKLCDSSQNNSTSYR